MHRSFANHASQGSIPANVRGLEQDIEATRDELDRTLDELQAKLSPRRQLRDALRATRQNGADLARVAVDYSRRYPLRTAIAGALLLAVAGRRLLARRIS